MFEKNMKLAYLLDFYVDLLDEHSQEIMRAYYEDDLSLAEIAASVGISRQGIRHVIKKCEEQILFYEEKLGLAERQAEIKELTNEFERILSVDGERKINLDPGLMNHGRVVLATTKPVGFRIPLKNGIYTELTLFYARGAWHKFAWTYRDYQSERVQAFLTKVRKIYLAQRKALIHEKRGTTPRKRSRRRRKM